MSGATHAAAGRGSALPDRLPARLLALARNLPTRLRERPFWIVQAGVLGVTAVHILAEWQAEGMAPAVQPALHHVPVILYLLPIGYASLRYGLEGAVLTGLWSGLLTTPNLLVWHAHGFEWLTEFVYVGVVVGAGIAMAVPVERERRQRQRAEATSRRLALLNDVATLTLTSELEQTVREVHATVVAELDLEAACVVTGEPDGSPGASVVGRYPADSAESEALAGAAAQHVRAAGPVRVGHRHGTNGSGMVAVPFDTELPAPGHVGRVHGVLAVDADAGRSLDEEDRRLLDGVSNQLAIALASARLADLERDRVRSYAHMVISAQEEERKRISRELHDEAAQNLVAIRRELDAWSASSDQPAGGDVERLRDITAQTLAALRRFSHDLRPPVLDDLGLASALESLVADVRARSGLAVELAVSGAPRRLEADIELALFRVAQSALHNVEHHAGARAADVVLTFQPDATEVAVTDDGGGFDPPSSLSDLIGAGKLGLLGMHERAQLVGGELEIDSELGRGTRIRMRVPQ